MLVLAAASSGKDCHLLALNIISALYHPHSAQLPNPCTYCLHTSFRCLLQVVLGFLVSSTYKLSGNHVALLDLLPAPPSPYLLLRPCSSLLICNLSRHAPASRHLHLPFSAWDALYPGTWMIFRRFLQDFAQISRCHLEEALNTQF